MIPKDMKFTKTHEWARLDAASGIVTVGITDFAAQQLGDIVFLDLPPAGRAVQQDAGFGVVESVKAAVDLCSPVSGEVVETNQPLAGNFTLLHDDPYGQAWMIRVKASKPSELDALMSADQYETYLKTQDTH